MWRSAQRPLTPPVALPEYSRGIWLTPLLGGNQTIRLVHHVLPWYFPAFVIVHVYMAVRHDAVERTGTISSIIAGGRFVPAGERHVDD